MRRVAILGGLVLALGGCGGASGGDQAPRQAPVSARVPAPPAGFPRTVPRLRAGRAVTLGRVDRRAQLGAYGGHLVYQVHHDGAWFAVHVAGGRAALLPIGPAHRPLRLDLGPGPDGAPTLVYTRCDSRSCTTHAYDLRRKSDVRLAHLEAPGFVTERASMWGRDVAFVRRRLGSPNVQVLLLDGRTGRTRRVPSEDQGCRSSEPDCRVEVTVLDLGRDLLAHVWRADFASDYSQPGTPHVLRRSTWRDRRVLSGYVSGACGSLAGTDAQVDGTTVQYVRRNYNCSFDSSYFFRLDARTQRSTSVLAPPQRRGGRGGAHAMAWDGRDTYWLYSSHHTGFDPQPFDCKGGCRVVGSRDLPFARPRPGDPRASDGAENTTA